MIRKQMLTFVLAAVLSTITLAGEFVPFVIPEKVNPASALAVKNAPINSSFDRLKVKDSHFYNGRDQRVRLWGVNLSFAASFPTHEDAVLVADRLAAYGINSVRCHHMDTARFPRGIWNKTDGKEISTEALDRLDFFMNELAKRGIYINLNLHVGRNHSRYLGLDDPGTSYDKMVDIFTPELIDAQKKYARQLINHINPYRKLRYGDDPAIAIVEITNEDSLFMWGNIYNIKQFPQFYKNILKKQYNQWLNKKYKTTDAIQNAWAGHAEPLGTNTLKNASLRIADNRTVPSEWTLEKHSGANAELTNLTYKDQDALKITIKQRSETGWHLQFHQPRITLKKDQYYTVLFQVASDKPRALSLAVAQAHDPWNNLGLSETLAVTEQWQTCRLGFTALADDDNARLSFSFGTDETPFYLRDIKLCTGGQQGLLEGESLEKQSIAFIVQQESYTRKIDRMAFMAEIEKDYFDDMYRFIKRDLKCRSMITGTIVFGPLGMYGQSDMDFVDSHAYWQHPSFPNGDWSSTNWFIRQKAMTDYPEEATLFRMASERLANKPFTVTEYNHPAPLDAQAETIPMIATFAAVQDWDGIWIYSYSHNDALHNRNTIPSFFDTDMNPSKFAFMPAGASIFRFNQLPTLQDIKPVNLNTTGKLIPSLADLHLTFDRNMYGVVKRIARVNWQDMTNTVYIPSYTDKPITATKNPDGAQLAFNWLINENHQGLYHVWSNLSSTFTGHTSLFKDVYDGIVTVTSPDFAAITFTPLVTNTTLPVEHNTYLLTACGRCENIDMQFNEDRTTVSNKWGHGPVRIEVVEGTIQLPDGKWTCQALAPDGTTAATVPVTYDGKQASIEISAKYKTMWYLLKRTDK